MKRITLQQRSIILTSTQTASRSRRLLSTINWIDQLEPFLHVSQTIPSPSCNGSWLGQQSPFCRSKQLLTIPLSGRDTNSYQRNQWSFLINVLPWPSRWESAKKCHYRVRCLVKRTRIGVSLRLSSEARRSKGSSRASFQASYP